MYGKQELSLDQIGILLELMYEKYEKDKRHIDNQYYYHLNWCVKNNMNSSVFLNSMYFLSLNYEIMKMSEYKGVWREFEFRLIEYIFYCFEPYVIAEYLDCDDMPARRVMGYYKKNDLSFKGSYPRLHKWMWKWWMLRVARIEGQRKGV